MLYHLDYILMCTSTGSAGATFATAACLSANIRDKDDYVNASIGGALAGSLFGVACKWVNSYYTLSNTICVLYKR